jgi:hypothetical protein
MTSLTRVTALAALTLGLATVAAAQDRRFAIEARGGVNVPTFDIADVAESGPSFGAGVSYRLSSTLWLIGDVDFGSHDVKGTSTQIDVNHYIAKLGYELTAGTTGPWSVILNAGAGAMTFDGGAASYTYPAINVGAKIAYRLGAQIALVLSPQGDIAFGKESEIGTTNAWVWPFAVGLRVTF